MNTILTVDNLTKNFGKVKAVQNLSFSIEKANVYGILGPNGSGKSTTLGMVLNVVNPTSGSFQWFDGSQSTFQALKKVGAIIERPNFYPFMSAWQNLKLVCKIKEADYSQIDQKLQLVGLFERKDSKFSTFSLGMKQRLAIASALLNDPEVLILDEPTNGLDPQGIHQIRKIIRTIADQGTTILLASHLLDEVEKVCSHVIILHHGEFLYSGRVAGMHAGYGFFTLQCKNMSSLREILKNHDAIENFTEENGFITAYLKNPVEAADFNNYLFSQGIILSHLAHGKESLEERFLQITNASNS